MANIEHLRKKQALLYFKMQEYRDRYEFFSNFLLSCDLSHDDLIVLTKHQIKFLDYHLESMVSFLSVLLSEQETMNNMSRRNPELYPRNCQEVYFKMHEAYKVEQANKKKDRWKAWADKRDKMFIAPRDEDLEFKNLTDDSDYLEASDAESGLNENDVL